MMESLYEVNDDNRVGKTVKHDAMFNEFSRRRLVLALFEERVLLGDHVFWIPT